MTLHSLVFGSNNLGKVNDLRFVSLNCPNCNKSGVQFAECGDNMVNLLSGGFWKDPDDDVVIVVLWYVICVFPRDSPPPSLTSNFPRARFRANKWRRFSMLMCKKSCLVLSSFFFSISFPLHETCEMYKKKTLYCESDLTSWVILIFLYKKNFFFFK